MSVLHEFPYNIFSGDSNINVEALSKHFDPVCIFESNKKTNEGSITQHSKLIAIGSIQEIAIKDHSNSLPQLQHFYDNRKGWMFGYLSYDLKNEIEDLSSKNIDGLDFPLLHFFSPLLVIQINDAGTILFFDDAHLSLNEAKKITDLAFSKNENSDFNTLNVTIKSRINKQKYTEAVNKLKQHIQRGDIYEVNFCMEFYAENTMMDPAKVFERLNIMSQAPFAAYYKQGDHHLLSSSPERFLQKKGNKLISQPIKGTIKRSAHKEKDQQLKEALRNSLKEQNENVMIVDLVRNDLSRIAKRGTVNVDELFGAYSFRQVHQLISTVSCEIAEGTSFTDIIKATFPMGSMTGAPKLSALRLIEEYESTKRGLYSGAIGYVSPNGDFDFSVVIRSILYNKKNKYLSFMTGSAITAKAEADKEYEECLLKAKAMFEALGIIN